MSFLRKMVGFLGHWITLLSADRSSSERKDNTASTGPLAQGLEDVAPSLGLP